MDRFIDIVKRYPLLIGGAVVVLVLLIWYMSSGGEAAAGPSTITAYGPSEASVKANADIVRSQIAAQSAAAGGQTAIELARIDAGVAESSLSTSRQISEVQAMRDIEMAKQSGATQVSLATIVTGASTSQAQIYADRDRDIAVTNKQRDYEQAYFQYIISASDDYYDYLTDAITGTANSSSGDDKSTSVVIYNTNTGSDGGNKSGYAYESGNSGSGEGNNSGNAQGGGGEY